MNEQNIRWTALLCVYDCVFYFVLNEIKKKIPFPSSQFSLAFILYMCGKFTFGFLKMNRALFSSVISIGTRIFSTAATATAVVVVVVCNIMIQAKCTHFDHHFAPPCTLWSALFIIMIGAHIGTLTQNVCSIVLEKWKMNKRYPHDSSSQSANEWYAKTVDNRQRCEKKII